MGPVKPNSRDWLMMPADHGTMETTILMASGFFSSALVNMG